ncbi:MAG: hypothetical protein HYT31_02870 [Parcubacteria group bacterium]|nr:hypothetical protein [Parcubacteria group bacterium]
MRQPYLNLIPEAHKLVLARERMFYFVHTIVGILVVALAANSILLILARFILVDYANQLKDDTSLVSVRHSSLHKEVQRINRALSDTAQVQANFVKYSDLLSDVAVLLGNGVTIDFLHVNTDANTLRVTGTAQNREALVRAQDALKSLPGVVSLDSPLENFLERENISFRFNAVLLDNIYHNPPAE